MLEQEKAKKDGYFSKLNNPSGGLGLNLPSGNKKVTPSGQTATITPDKGKDEDVFELKSKTPKLRANLNSNFNLPRGKKGDSETSTNN
jgi:hypothetical protein